MTQYHFDTLSLFKPFLLQDVQSFFPNFKIMEDTIDAIPMLEDGCDILLYNVSIYKGAIYTEYLFKQFSDLNIFYHRSDKILKPYKEDLLDTDTLVVDDLMSSYEHDRNRSVEDFFLQFN